MSRVACLYVDARGPYPALVGPEMCWDEKRDARTYAGPWPVVAHPPCQRWCKLAGLNAHLHGYAVGDDGGCFGHALKSVRAFGGVLEHPAFTLAWPAFDLPRPKRDAWTGTLLDPGWVTEISQRAYGHKARKRTWLYAVTGDVPSMDWTDPRPEAQCSSLRNHGDSGLPALGTTEAKRTPPAFATWLVELASQVTPRQQSTIEETSSGLCACCNAGPYDGHASDCPVPAWIEGRK